MTDHPSLSNCFRFLLQTQAPKEPSPKKPRVASLDEKLEMDDVFDAFFTQKRRDGGGGGVEGDNRDLGGNQPKESLASLMGGSAKGGPEATEEGSKGIDVTSWKDDLDTTLKNTKKKKKIKFKDKFLKLGFEL